MPEPKEKKNTQGRVEILRECWKSKQRNVYERSNPAPELMACKSFTLRIFSSVYIGSFSKLTQVLAVGNRSLSLPASRIANFGTSSLNPLPEQGQILGDVKVDGTKGLTAKAADCSSSRTSTALSSDPG